MLIELIASIQSDQSVQSFKIMVQKIARHIMWRALLKTDYSSVMLTAIPRTAWRAFRAANNLFTDLCFLFYCVLSGFAFAAICK
jgi:hypothetical protein